MANIRIIASNAISRATLSAATTAGLLTVTNLQSDDKSNVYRAAAPTATTATITATWSVAESLSGVAALGNFSPTATIRVQCYDAVSGGTLLLDTNTLQPGALACPAAAIVLDGWTAAQSASAYAYGGGTWARIWFAPTSGVKRMVVTITDPNNVQGAVEAAYMVAGLYLSPTYNPSEAPTTYVDSTQIYRTDAGSQKATAGTISQKLAIDLGAMPASDRTLFANLLRNSRARPIFISVFPGIADLELERDNMICGRRMSDSEMAIQYAITYGTKIEVESI
jgi:hypothetical protein